MPSRAGASATSATLPADVRVVAAATTKTLDQEVHDGAFRDDLYFRLAVVTIEVPPLRRRVEDIPIIARSLLASIGPAGSNLGEGELVALMAYAWPGNVREMRNVLERAVHLAQADGRGDLALLGFPPPGRRRRRTPVRGGEAVPANRARASRRGSSGGRSSSCSGATAATCRRRRAPRGWTATT